MKLNGKKKKHKEKDRTALGMVEEKVYCRHTGDCRQNRISGRVQSGHDQAELGLVGRMGWSETGERE